MAEALVLVAATTGAKESDDKNVSVVLFYCSNV